MTKDVQENGTQGKCTGCERAWDDEPNALCNRLVHWHAWTARLRDALREACDGWLAAEAISPEPLRIRQLRALTVVGSGEVVAGDWEGA